MKKQNILYSLIILLFSIVFISCSDDDDNKSKYEFNGVCKHAVNLKGYADQSNITLTSNITLDEMLEAYDYKSPITAGLLYKTDSNTFFKITNLEEGRIIKNLILTINGITHTFKDDITSSNANLYTNDTSNYFERVFNSMISQRKLNVKVSFSLRTDLTPEENVNLDMSFSGRYTYWK